ncbi:MAG: S41 family peptidase [Bacteroidota bacterium]
MRITFSILAMLLLLLPACTNETKNESINGTWASIGSGWFLEIQDSSRYTFYDHIPISCLPNRQGPLTEIIESLHLQTDTLSLLKGVITYQFIRAKVLPKNCTTPLDAQKATDPLYNFEVFAETVKEHYAFMPLNRINWDSLYQQQKAKVAKSPTEAQLYSVLEETLEKLNDNHAYLEATEAVYEAAEQLAKERNEEEMEEEESLPELGDFQVADQVAEHYLQEEMTKDSWLMKWGKLTDKIGYVQIKSMWLYADMKLSKSRMEEIGFLDAYVEAFHKMYEGDYINKEVEGVHKIMDQVMSDLSDTKAMVLDVRFNGGGQDAVSFEILRRFIPQKLQVATQQLRYGDQRTSVLPLYIEGAKDAYTKPVFLLTSAQTGSAAEAFSIASMAMNNAKRIGSPSAGAMSTALEKTLPNGWAFAISNEIYMDNQGQFYENKGIPVDYDLEYTRDRQSFFRAIVNDLEKDKQAVLKAVATLQGK